MIQNTPLHNQSILVDLNILSQLRCPINISSLSPKMLIDLRYQLLQLAIFMPVLHPQRIGSVDQDVCLPPQLDLPPFDGFPEFQIPRVRRLGRRREQRVRDEVVLRHLLLPRVGHWQLSETSIDVRLTFPLLAPPGLQTAHVQGLPLLLVKELVGLPIGTAPLHLYYNQTESIIHHQQGFRSLRLQTVHHAHEDRQHNKKKSSQDGSTKCQVIYIYLFRVLNWNTNREARLDRVAFTID
jgi:hypothetical protein